MPRALAAPERSRLITLKRSGEQVTVVKNERASVLSGQKPALICAGAWHPPSPIPFDPFPCYRANRGMPAGSENRFLAGKPLRVGRTCLKGSEPHDRFLNLIGRIDRITPDYPGFTRIGGKLVLIVLVAGGEASHGSASAS